MATKTKKNELFSSLLYIVIGVLLAVFPGEALGWCMTIVGVLFIVSGVLDLIKRNLIGGGVSLVIGMAILLLGWKLLDIVVLVLGILIAVKGVIALIDAIRGHGNAITVVFAALTIAIGAFLAFGNAVAWIVIVCGVLLAVDGVLGLVGSLKK